MDTWIKEAIAKKKIEGAFIGATSDGAPVIISNKAESYTPVFLSKHEHKALERMVEANKANELLLAAFSTWYEPYWLGTQIAYLISSIVAGDQLDVLPDDSNGRMFVKLLNAADILESLSPHIRIVEDLADLAENDEDDASAGAVWDYICTKPEFSMRLDNLVNRVAIEVGQSTDPARDVHSHVDDTIVYDALKNFAVDDNQIGAVASEVTRKIIDYIIAKIPK